MIFSSGLVRTTLIALVTLIAGIPSCFAGSDLNDRISAAFARVYGATAVHEYKEIALTDSMVAEVRRLSGWRYGKRVALHLAKQNGRVIGYGLVDDMMGKEQPITYLLFTNLDLSVRDLEVLYYREAYGGEIQNETWRAQFNGRGLDPSLRVGAGIANISGATISTNAVTYGVRKLLAVLKVMRDHGLLP